MSWFRLQAGLPAATKLVVVNFPHNPTGESTLRCMKQTAYLLLSILQKRLCFLVSQAVKALTTLPGVITSCIFCHQH
jgi:hypothetical protein